MCQTCNNQGGITVNHGWCMEVVPCTSPDCDHDYEAAHRRNIAILRDLLVKCEADIA